MPLNRLAIIMPATTETMAPRCEIGAGCPTTGLPQWMLLSRPRM